MPVMRVETLSLAGSLSLTRGDLSKGSSHEDVYVSKNRPATANELSLYPSSQSLRAYETGQRNISKSLSPSPPPPAAPVSSATAMSPEKSRRQPRGEPEKESVLYCHVFSAVPPSSSSRQYPPTVIHVAKDCGPPYLSGPRQKAD